LAGVKEDEVTSERFDGRGRLIIPEPKGPVRQMRIGEELIVEEVYCPNGHDVMDRDHPMSGRPGIRIAFRDPRGEAGLLVLSPVLGCLDKLTLEGELVLGERLEAMCPDCGIPLPVLTACPCEWGGVINVLFLHPDRDINNSIGFCNVVGCPNSSVTRSGEVIRAVRLEGW
jgi:hypothetical protein